MAKYAFIPTRDKSTVNTELQDYLTEAGFNVNFLIGKNNIFEAYEEACKPVMAKDTVVMCHDDIKILNSTESFNAFLDKDLDKSSTGFVGVAGARVLNQSAMWWEGIQSTGSPNHSGFVWHGDDLNDMSMSFYGIPAGDVVVLDGLFLAAKGATLNSIQLKKPSFFEGDWDFYDIFYTFQAFKKGFRNKAIPLQILHSSVGNIEGKDSWHNNRKAFADYFVRELPTHV